MSKESRQRQHDLGQKEGAANTSSNRPHGSSKEEIADAQAYDDGRKAGREQREKNSR